MVVELKRQINILNHNLDQAANIQGEAASLEALRNAMDVTNDLQKETKAKESAESITAQEALDQKTNETGTDPS